MEGNAMKALLGGFFILFCAVAQANGGVACATLSTLEACIQCGAKKYGLEAQTRHCQSKWRPGQQVEQITRAEGIRRFGDPRTGKCGEGQISCAQWCRKYNAQSNTCMSGHPNSCATKVRGAATCVDDRPRG